MGVTQLSGISRSSALVAACLVAALQLAAAPPAQALDAAGRDQALKAMAAADTGQWQWATATARRSGEPLVVAYVQWLRLKDAQDNPPLAAYRDFLQAHPGWPMESRLLANAEESIDEGTPYAERLRFFEGREPRTRKGRLRLAEALSAAGRRAEAVALLRRSWIEDDFPKADEDYLFGLYGDDLTRADHVARTERLLWERKTAAARRMLPLLDKDRRAWANARIQLQESAPGVDGALRAVPASLSSDPGLALDRLRWRRAKGRDAEARAILLDPPAKLGRPDLWWEERAPLVRQAIDTKDYKTAYRLVVGHGLSEGSAFAEAEWLAGWLALRFNDNPAAALAHFRRLGEGVRTPISKARAAYWAGRAAAAAGRKAEAQRWYTTASGFPTTYYGQLAVGELGLQLAAREAKNAAFAGDDGRVARLEPARMMRLLCELGEHERAIPFVARLASDAQGDPAATAGVLRLATGCGRAHIAIRAAKGVTVDREPDLRASHPVPRIRALSGRQLRDPEPALRLAVARQESMLDPVAKSRAGALGLMQLMPATAAAVAKELGIKHDAGRLTRDPEYNAQLGSAYLHRMVRRYDGELVLALAAYNAGPGRASQWIGQLGDPRRRDAYGLIDWVELIPFAETRNYVQRVLENRAVYELVLAHPEAARLVALPSDKRREALNTEPDDGADDS